MPFTDVTNAFKAYRKTALNSIKIKSKGFEILPEIIIKLWKKGYKICALPTVWTGREKGRSKMKLLSVGYGYLKVILSNLF